MLKNECCGDTPFTSGYVKFEGLWWTLCFGCGRSYTRLDTGLRFIARGGMTAT